MGIPRAALVHTLSDEGGHETGQCFELEEVVIPDFSVFVGSWYVLHVGAGWKAEHGLLHYRM